MSKLLLRRLCSTLSSFEQNACYNLCISPKLNSYESIQETAGFLLKSTKHRPKIGMICGSGLGGIANLIQEADPIPYQSIPNFPVSTVAGHSGRLVFGKLDGVTVVCMEGRFHYYEGYPLAKTAMPVRVMKLMGVSHLVATNAAGGINQSYNLGDVMVLKDHINMMGFAGNNPLHGPNDERFGLRFPSLSKAYAPHLIEVAFGIAKEMGHEEELHKGVYASCGGPNYETIAELRLLRSLGADAVGMSTVPEVITARHCDMTVFTFSLITNKCILEYETDVPTSHKHVIETGERRKKFLEEFFCRMINAIQKDVKANRK